MLTHLLREWHPRLVGIQGRVAGAKAQRVPRPHGAHSIHDENLGMTPSPAFDGLPRLPPCIKFEPSGRARCETQLVPPRGIRCNDRRGVGMLGAGPPPSW